MKTCKVKQGIRISLETDRRIFTPIDRASYKWEKYYNKRTSVERVNSRLDVSFGYDIANSLPGNNLDRLAPSYYNT